MKQGNPPADNFSQRNYGIDLLRILSMIMIPTLHVLGHGGILKNASPLSMHYDIAWLIEIACYCAVNSFAIISGYVGYGSKHKYSNIFYLYFQVLFYTLLSTVVFSFYKPELVTAKTIIKAFLPFTGTYWYFAAYFCLFFLMPFLDMLLDKFKKEDTQKLLITLFFVFSLLPTIFHSDFGCTEKGYSFLWLAILYLLGAYIRKYGFFLFKSKAILMLGYIVCVLVTWLSKLIVESITTKLFHTPRGGRYLIEYTSPTIVLCSLFLFLFFLNLRFAPMTKKMIGLLAPVSFGVYLLHEEPLIRSHFMIDNFANYLSLNPIVMALAILGTALGIWIIGSIIDYLRLMIFNILKLRKLSNFLEHILLRFISKP